MGTIRIVQKLVILLNQTPHCSFMRGYFFSFMDQKAKDHFEKANKQLQKANEELFKPKEDVVSYLVCKNALFAIENYLKGYLSKRGFETKTNDSLDLLLERCRLLDKKFNQIDLSVIDCSSKPDHNRYCEDVDKVNSCFQTADHLENFLIAKGIV
jgi:hypothetical protein